MGPSAFEDRQGPTCNLLDQNQIFHREASTFMPPSDNSTVFF